MGRRTLVVDDDPLVLEAVVSMLEELADSLTVTVLQPLARRTYVERQAVTHCLTGGISEAAVAK
jgi:CheY-like chemotaxis protein